MNKKQVHFNESHILINNKYNHHKIELCNHHKIEQSRPSNRRHCFLKKSVIVFCSARAVCLMQCPCSKSCTVDATSRRRASLAPNAKPSMFLICISASLAVMTGRVSASPSPLSSSSSSSSSDSPHACATIAASQLSPAVSVIRVLSSIVTKSIQDTSPNNMSPSMLHAISSVCRGD